MRINSFFIIININSSSCSWLCRQQVSLALLQLVSNTCKYATTLAEAKLSDELNTQLRQPISDASSATEGFHLWACSHQNGRSRAANIIRLYSCDGPLLHKEASQNNNKIASKHSNNQACVHAFTVRLLSFCIHVGYSQTKQACISLVTENFTTKICWYPESVIACISGESGDCFSQWAGPWTSLLSTEWWPPSSWTFFWHWTQQYRALRHPLHSKVGSAASLTPARLVQSRLKLASTRQDPPMKRFTASSSHCWAPAHDFATILINKTLYSLACSSAEETVPYKCQSATAPGHQVCVLWWDIS